MAIIKWEPFGEFDSFFSDVPSWPFPKAGWELAVDVYEKDGDVVAEMNIPGIDPKDIGVSVEDNHLRISGMREEEKEEKKKHYYSKEIRRGSFERVVRLPQPVEKSKVSAEYKKGVLRVTMPKSEGAKADKVKVEVKD
jgi:HSP20 family protein